LIAGALLGVLTVTGIAGAYTRMLQKVASFNQLRQEKEALRSRYSELEKIAREKEIQVASLGSLASEVTALYGLRPDPMLEAAASEEFQEQQVAVSLDQLTALKTSALGGGATLGLSMMSKGGRALTTADWVRLAAAPTLWPVEGRLTSSFGERLDPFNGEGAFHSGVDISGNQGAPILAPADGVIVYADYMRGYGRLLVIAHAHGISTRYGHLSGFAVSAGQNVSRGDVVGYVGDTGRSTAPHVHYEVRINNVPVNPRKYLRTTMARATYSSAGD
jgi:murein DD-endopeptidase MepM/ murein hydrolase activator NlpD